MLKCIALGRCCYDITLVVDKMPTEGSVMEFAEKKGCGGGSAANMAYALAKWGVNVSFSGVTGNDVYGTRIKKEFDSVHIDTRYMDQSFDADTPLSLVTVNKTTKTHTIYNIYDRYISCKKLDYDFSPDFFICDGYDPVASKEVMLRFPKAVSFLDANICSKSVQEVMAKVKYCICSVEFAETLAGMRIDYNNPATLVSLYQKIKKKFLSTEIVITLGEHGALYFYNNQIKLSPSLKVESVDTYGSGSTFRAAFAYTIMAGGDVEKAVKVGCIAGSLATREVGARTGIPAMSEIKNIYEQNYD